jgi:hypothetical protein
MDVSDSVRLLASTWYVSNCRSNEDFVSFHSFMAHNNGEAVFNKLSGFIIGNEIVWSERICISTGGTPATSGNYN